MSDETNGPNITPGVPPPVPGRPRNTQEEAVATVIPYRNPMALAAYYMGIFSILPLVGLFLGAAAFVCGILGLRHASRNEGAHGRAHAAIGIGCGGLLFVVQLIIVVAVVFFAASSTTGSV